MCPPLLEIQQKHVHFTKSWSQIYEIQIHQIVEFRTRFINLVELLEGCFVNYILIELMKIICHYHQLVCFSIWFVLPLLREPMPAALPCQPCIAHQCFCFDPLGEVLYCNYDIS
jgi:hypothetical protein